jgi:hypothetical protein
MNIRTSVQQKQAIWPTRPKYYGTTKRSEKSTDNKINKLG